MAEWGGINAAALFIRDDKAFSLGLPEIVFGVVFVKVGVWCPVMPPAQRDTCLDARLHHFGLTIQTGTLWHTLASKHVEQL